MPERAKRKILLWEVTDMTVLEAADKRWAEFLKQDGAPPLIGLAPMSETEVAQIATESRAWLGMHLDHWHRLFEKYPAATFAWFGSAAGSAYSEGTFWPKFEGQTGLVGAFSSQGSRRELVGWCHRVAKSFRMPLPPESEGTFSLVSALLFFGGFPSCHSSTFAREVRAIQKNNELPDPDSEEAGEELCELLKWRMRNLPFPILKRALAGPAGPIICNAALSVLGSGDFTQINPHIGEALRQAFENAQPVRGSATFHSPHLRLSNDLLSLEIVCPAQDAALVRNSQMRWVIDGQAHLCSPREDFVVPLPPGKSSCHVEAAGLVSARTITREVALPSAPTKVWVFAGGTRKLRKVFDLSGTSAVIQCGDYHVLYPANGIWGDDPLCWPAFSDDWFARSVDCRPAQSFSLTGGSTRWTLAGASAPSVWPEGTCFISGEGHRVYYGQTSLRAWWPGDDAINSDEWEVEVRFGDSSMRIALHQPEVSDVGATASIDLGEAIFQMLPVGASLFQVSLYNRSRRQATRDIIFWKGLEEYTEEPQVFRVSSTPENLDGDQTVGFQMDPDIRPHRDGHPQRRLAFRQAGGQVFVLSWRNVGIFLESFDREPGVPVQPTHHALGSRFAASLDSRKFLRIWSDSGFETLAIGGLPEQREGRGGSVELSLAELSTRFPQGGSISLGGNPVAGFTSPLVPKLVSRIPGDASRGLDFVLRERVAGVRIVAQEMIEQMVLTTPVHWFGESDSVEIAQDGMPTSNLSRRDGEASGEFHIEIQAPLEGWSLGVWVLFVEVCRRPSDQPEAVVFGKGKRSPLLVFSQPAEGDSDAPPLISALAKAWRKTRSGDAEQQGLDISEYKYAVPEILGFLRRWHRFFEAGVSGGIAKDFEWIDFLEKAIAQLSEGMIQQGESEGARWLLNLANTHKGKRRLLRTPEVLCLSAKEYSDLPEGEPLLDALSVLQWLSDFDLASDAVRDSPVRFAPKFLQCFSNYSSIAQGELEEFSGFDIQSCWQSLSISDFSEQAQPPADQLLGAQHWKWAMQKFILRYNPDNTSEGWGHATGCMMNGLKPLMQIIHPIMPLKLVSRTSQNLAPRSLSYPSYAIIEATPSFCSAWALSNRLVAAKQTSLGGIYGPLMDSVKGEANFRAGLQVLLEACPELFGFFLLFWEFQIKVHPYQ